ncbi:hypothetical protein [Paractinoplanes lichenicola]|uniref:Uncharacterized protein n=1 Tax=Paractinoplanes lichenicola TaxID=2802976 RepID=A0ABS1VP57_9ACTN|nr:hypothetical protein [Actinoplanes lichenicola]MBL7256005.1 hypothetical protein [Actinoplanes lichenicola]
MSTAKTIMATPVLAEPDPVRAILNVVSVSAPAVAKAMTEPVTGRGRCGGANARANELVLVTCASMGIG